MRTVNFSDARNNLKDVLDRVVADSDVTIITRRDADDVVVMSLSEWNSWKETEYLLASPANARHLMESLAQLDKGRKVYRELIEAEGPLRVGEPRAPYRARAKKKVGASASRPRVKKRG